MSQLVRDAFCDDALYKLTFTFTLHYMQQTGSVDVTSARPGGVVGVRVTSTASLKV